MKSGHAYVVEGSIRTKDTNEYDDIRGLIKTIQKKRSRNQMSWEMGALASLPYLNSRLVRVEEELRRMREPPIQFNLTNPLTTRKVDTGNYTNPSLPVHYTQSPTYSVEILLTYNTP